MTAEKRSPAELPLGSGHMTITTKSGRALVIRHLLPNDALLLSELYGSLSPQSRYLRFFTPRGIPDELLRSEGVRMSDIDPRMHIGLVVLANEAGSEWVVAEARLIRDEDDPRQAEVAILVRDDWQREGIGQVLFDLLIQTALVQALRRVYAITLAQNLGIRRLIQRLGLPFATVNDGSEIIYWIALLADQPLPGPRPSRLAT